MSAPIGKPPPMPLATVIASGVMPACWKANHAPVRPAPVWISSTISSAPCALGELARRLQVALGQLDDARLALDGLDEQRRDAVVHRGLEGLDVASMCSTPGTIGRNGSCIAGLPVRASVPIVRPWKASSSVRMRVRSVPGRAGARA